MLKPPVPDDTDEDTDELGQPIDEDIELAKLWASIEPLSGRELFAAQEANAEVTTRITLRFHKDIDRTMFVKHGVHEFEILYIINPKFANKELQLMCKERQ